MDRSSMPGIVRCPRLSDGLPSECTKGRNSTCSYCSLFCDLVARPQGRSTTRGRSLRAPRAPGRRGRARQGGGEKRKRQASQQIETRATIRRPNGRRGGPGLVEEVSGRTRALSLADESIGVLASLPGGASTVFGKILGKAFLWYRQRRGLGASWACNDCW
ncbi:uncharacterized protein LOC131592119 [Poecile atricapillus]|uniref:uncharacterized protein LOC131592119 n=1 Tax=Poecile atricapillus TaxID=48891 RepID=UPI00273941D9|nr:uncharacterized protein LOC131592119 [Poecile atricapillus]